MPAVLAMPSLHPWAFERGTLWAHESEDGDVAPIRSILAATYAEARSDLTDALAVAMGLADAAEVAQRFSGGRRCFVAQVDGSIAAYGWVSQSSERIGELERTFHMIPDEAYIWDCATLPRYRGQRLYCALLSHIMATLHHEGIRRIWIGASLQNTPSIRAFATARFRPVLDLEYVRFFALRHIWLRRHPTVSPELFARARQALTG